MRVSDTYRLDTGNVLTGVFRNNSDIYHAREILTDFGYPKEAMSVIELKEKSKKAKAYGKELITQVRHKIILGVGIGTILNLSALLVGVRFYSDLNFSEAVVLLIVWVSLLAIGAVACGFMGALAAALVGSMMPEEGVDVEAGTEKTKMFIRVAVRTPNDAEDIAREWKEIGGEVV